MEKQDDILEEVSAKLSREMRIPQDKIKSLLEKMAAGESSEENTQKIVDFPTKNHMDKKSVEEMIQAVRREMEIVKRYGLYTEKGTLQTYEKVKNNMVVRLHNLIRDRELLENAVYRVCGDIAITVYWRADSGNTLYCMRILERMLKSWRKSKETVIQDALYNTLRVSPPKRYDQTGWVLGQTYVEDIEETAGWKNGLLGNCISTEEVTFGAVAIFLPGVAQKIADIYQGDFYFAFPFQHGVMVHNVQGTDPDMVWSSIIHLTSDRREDFVSCHVFRYFRETEKMEIIR